MFYLPSTGYHMFLYFYSLKVSTFLFYLPVGPLAQATQRPKTLSSKLECDLWYDLIRGEYGEYWCWYPCRALGAQLDDLMCDSAELGLVYTIIHFWFHMKWMSLRILTVHPVPTSQWNYGSSCQLTLDPREWRISLIQQRLLLGKTDDTLEGQVDIG